MTLLFSVTSRKPKVDERDGQMYSFMTRSEMECDIKNGRFLEHGEYDGNLYGTKISSIHEVMETGKICILDVNPQVEETHLLAFNSSFPSVEQFSLFRNAFPPPKALKVLRTSEFLPYVVFIEAPDFEVLKAMNRSAIESGVVTKQLTVSVYCLKGSWKHTVSPQVRKAGTPQGSTVFPIGPTARTSSGNTPLSSPIGLSPTDDVE